uniref:Uncharacterized protein n=1 Tax=Molossus molossus TaxID=27622 RepID=A0A7J8I563_MOLMO|nr:hypothetical protein HJG59_001906 [Molossus molossus]
MLNSDVSDHRLNVEAIIRNINTISLELKKMKVNEGLRERDLILKLSQYGPAKNVPAKFRVGRSAGGQNKGTGGNVATASPYLLPSESSSQHVNLAFLQVTDLDVVNFIFV